MSTTLPEALAAALRLLLFPLGLLLLHVLSALSRARSDPTSAAALVQPAVQLIAFLLASLALYPLSGATALVQFTYESDAWVRASFMLDAAGRALFWLAQGPLLTALIATDKQKTRARKTMACAAVLMSLAGAVATALGLWAPSSASSSSLTLVSHAVGLSLDLTFLACSAISCHSGRTPSSAAVPSALSALLGDVLGILGAMSSEGSAVGRWIEVARAATVSMWAVALIALFVALELGLAQQLRSSRATGRSTFGGNGGHYSRQGHRASRQIATSLGGVGSDSQYDRLSSAQCLSELSSPTATGRLDISPAMTWSSPEVSTPRSTSRVGHASRIASLYCPPHDAPTSITQDGADDSGNYTIVELVAVPVSPKHVDLAVELPPDKFSPPPQPISARLRPTSPRAFDLRRASDALPSPSPTRSAFRVSPSHARHRSLPHPWTVQQQSTPTGSPLNSPLPRLSLSDDPDPFSRSSIGAAPILKHSSSYDPDLSAPRPSPRDLGFPCGGRHSQQPAAVEASEIKAPIHLTHIQEGLRPPMNHSRWSTDSSILQPRPHGLSSFWSRRARAAPRQDGLPGASSSRAQPPLSIGHDVSDIMSVQHAGNTGVHRSPLSRLGSLVGKQVSTLTNGSADDTGPPTSAAWEPRPVDTHSGRIVKKKKRPSTLNLADVSHSLRGSTSASPLVSALSAHQRGGSVDKASISRPTPIEGLSSWVPADVQADSTIGGPGSSAQQSHHPVVSTPSNPRWV